MSAKPMRSTVIAAACSLFAISLGCESLRTGAQPQQPTWFQRPSYSMHVVYRASVVAPSRRDGEAYQRGQVEIDAVHRRIFVGSSDHGLYCLDARDGSQLWRFETVGHVQSAPLYDPSDESVYFGSDDGALYKLDASNGELRYRFSTNAEVSERPVLAGNRLYLVNANDTVICIDPKLGKLLWNQHRSPVAGMQLSGHSGLLVWGNRVFVGFSDGMVVAYDSMTGAERWQPIDLAAEAEQTLGTAPEHFDVDTTPVADVVDGAPVVYVASAHGGLFALDAESGTQIWHTPSVIGTTQLLLWNEPRGNRAADSAAVAEDEAPASRAKKLLIAATGASGLWAIEPSDGAVVWRSRLPDGGVSGPVPVAGALLVSASQLGMYLVSPLNGRVIDGIHVVEGVSALPAARGNHAFVLTNSGDLLGLHVAAPSEHGEPGSPWDVNPRSSHW
ncbi:MAG TPA: PQQ-binding-like beta-propeller repeat protein [Polyangiaceae bacterium]